jgi:hypothetical protein
MKALVITLSVINIIQGVTFTIFDIKYGVSVKLIKVTFSQCNVDLGMFKERIQSKDIIRSIKIALVYVGLFFMLFRACFVICFAYALVCINIISGGYYLFHIGMEYSNSQLTFLIVIAIMSFLFYGTLMALYLSGKDKFQQILK